MKDNPARSAIQAHNSNLAALLGPIRSALDLPLSFTTFRDRFAKEKCDHGMSLREFAKVIRDTRAPTKAALPMFRLSSFGDRRTEKGSLRHAPNEQFISGVIVEHDAESVPMAQAAEWAREAGVAAIFYPSSSHHPDRPRWRGLLPLEHPLHAQDEREAYEALAGRVQTIFRNSLADGELYTRALSFYFGDSGQPGFEVIEVDGMALDAALLIEPTPRPKPKRIEGARSTATPLSVSDEFVAGVLDHIANDDSLHAMVANDHVAQGYGGRFMQVGFGLWRQFRDDREAGLELYHEWASRCPEYDARQTDARWNGFKEGNGGGYSLWGLIQIAEANGFNAAEYGYDWADEFDDLDQPPARSAITLAELLAGDVAAPAQKKAPLIEWYHDTPLPKAAPYLVRGILDQGAASCMYGASNSGKTFAAVDLCFALATAEEGSLWNGARVKRAAILYCALEGGSGFQKRIRALHEHTGNCSKIPFAYRRRGANLLANDDKGDVKEIVKAAREVQSDATATGLPLLIVVDTLSRALAGGDENGPQDMSAFIANVDRIRELTGAHVMIVHHTGKDQAKGMRGHSSLLAAIDSELEVTRPEAGKVVCVRVGKQRDSQSDYDLANAQLVTVKIGTDDEGDAIESAVLQWGAGKPTQRKEDKLPPTSRAALAVLEQGGAASREQWRDACVALGDKFSTAESRSAKRGVFNRAMEHLVRGDWVSGRDGQYSIVDMFDDLPSSDTATQQRHSVDTVS